MVRSVLHIAVALATSLLLATAASAQTDEDTARANALVQDAVEAFKQSDFTTAAQMFREAHEIVPQPSLKLNEMVAWYKGGRCKEAEAAVEWIEREDVELTEQDVKDVDRVTSDCAYARAERAFDAEDIDEAERLLDAIDTDDDDVRLKIATLRGKIEERRKAMTEQDPVERTEDPPPEEVEPPAQGLKFAGFGLAGAGAATLVGLLVKFLFEANRLSEWNEYFEAKYGCTYAGGEFTGANCNANGPTSDEAYPEFRDSIQTSNSTNLILGAAGGGLLAVGGGLLGYYYLRESAYEDAQRERVTIAPLIGPDAAGVIIHLRF